MNLLAFGWLLNFCLYAMFYASLKVVLSQFEIKTMKITIKVNYYDFIEMFFSLVVITDLNICKTRTNLVHHRRNQTPPYFFLLCG